MPKRSPYPRGDPNPWNKLNGEERKQINKFLIGKPMSWYENDEFKDNSNDDESMFLNKLLGDGDSIVVKLKTVEKREQSVDTPDWAKSDDGMEIYIEFETKEGDKKVMTQNSPKGALIRVLRGKQIEIGSVVQVTRTGEGTETRYKVEKVDSEGNVVPPKEEEQGDGIPF